MKTAEPTLLASSIISAMWRSLGPGADSGLCSQGAAAAAMVMFR